MSRFCTNGETCGILTSDVYSQISPKSGKAFAILSLGSLTPLSSSSSIIGIGGDNTVRPSITVFLFGNALSALHADTIKYMKVGYVVSVLGPNLLPPRQQQQGGGCSSSGSSTSVTLSVSDAKQILHIGKAADCDRCKGTARKRVTNTTGTNNMNNRWEDVRCSTLVDTRQFGGYCTAHRRQGLLSSSSSSSGSTTKAGGSTFMQRHRQESASSRITTTTVAPPRGSGTKRPSPLTEALSKSGLLDQIIPTPTASITMDTSKPLRHLSRAPMHMKKKMGNEENSTRPVVMTTLTSAVVPTANPYMSKRMIDQSLSTCGREDDTMKERKKQCDNEDILGNALEQQTKKRSRATHRKDDKQVHRPITKVFTVEGYDGSVQVPKPNTVLFRPRSNEHAMRNNTVTPSPTSLSSSVILERQKNLAELLKNQTPIANDNTKLISQRLSKSTNALSVKGTSGEFASIFGQIDNGIQQQSSSLNDIANARSRFASAVDAQEYTRARAIVQALELREESATRSSNNGMKKKTKKESSQAKDLPRVAIVTAGWTCRTCQKVTPYKPSACVRINHDVQQRRELKDERGTKKSATTGLSSRKDQLINEGLILGSGLEWSGWRGGF